MGLIDELRERFPVRRFLFGVAITLALFAWMAHSSDWRDVAGLWHQRRAAPLAGAALAYLTVYTCRAIRYRATGAALPPERLVALTALHGFLNRTLPARGGELAYGYLVRRLGGGSFTSAMLGLVQIRILDLMAVAGILSAALVTYVGDIAMARDQAIAIAVSALVLCTIGYLATGPLVRGGIRLLRALAPRRLGSGRGRELLDHLDELGAGIASTPIGTRVLLLAASAGAWLAIFLCYWLILRGVGQARPLAMVVLGASFASLVSSLPITAFGSFGALEASWAFAFGALGMDQRLAIATAWAASLLTLAFNACLALVGWATLTRIEARERRSRFPAA